MTMTVKNTNTFNQSVKPLVPLPRNGEDCRHDRHFDHLLRQVVHQYDYKAQNDFERFVWAGTSYFQDKCRDWETKEQPHRNEINRAKQLLIAVGLLEPAQRFRNGQKLSGYVMASHEDVTVVFDGKCCICSETFQRKFQGKFHNIERKFQRKFQERQKKVSQRVSPESAARSINKGDNDEVDSGLYSGFRGSKSGKVFESLEGSEVNEEKSRATPFNAFPLDHTFSAKDILNADLEQILDTLGDGEVETGTLVNYPHIDELTAACHQALRENSSLIIIDRLGCKRLMERINKIMRAQTFEDAMGRNKQLNPPRCWIPVMKKLAEGGPLRHVSFEEQRRRETKRRAEERRAFWEQQQEARGVV